MDRLKYLSKTNIENCLLLLLHHHFLHLTKNIREAFKKSTELCFFPNRGGGGLDQTPENQTHILKCPNDGPLEAVSVCV